MIIKNGDVVFENVEKGVKRKVMAHDGNLMAVEVHFEKNALGKVHSHYHEQVSYIVEGSFELEINGVKKLVSKGDTFYVKSNLPHGVLALEDSIILDVFTPQREDFLDKV